MSLCFLDTNDSPEAVFFKTTNEQCWIRLNTSSSPGALWGLCNVNVSSPSQYLGFTTGEQPLTIEPDAVHIPDQTAFIIGRERPLFSVYPNVNQPTITMDADHVEIKAPLTLTLPQSNDAFRIGETLTLNRQRVIVTPSERIDLAAPDVSVGESISITPKETLFSKPVTFLNTITASNVHIEESLSLPENSVLQCDQATASSLDVSQRLTVDSTSLFQSLGKTHLQSKELQFKMDTGRIWIGSNTQRSTNAFTPIQMDTEVSIAHLRVGGHLDVFGDVNVSKTLLLSDPMATHTVQGSLTVNGASLTVTRATPEFQKGVVIHQSCVIGQTHKPVEMIVYGTTHLSKGFYSHDCAYFDKTVRMNAELVFSPNAVSAPHQTVVGIPKGSLVLNNGHLWINTPSTSSTLCNPAWVFMANGNSSIQGQLTVTNGLSVNQPTLLNGTTEIMGQLTCRSDVALTKKFTVMGSTEFKGGSIFKESVQFQPGANLTLSDGTLDVHGNIQATTLTTSANVRIGETLEVPNCSTRLRNRRYAVYEPFVVSHERWIKFITIPYNRGYTQFYVKLQGHFFTPKQTKSFTIELGGTIQSPTLKHCSINGTLGTNIDPFANITFYQHTTTHDLVGYIEFQRRFEVGIEIDIEIGAEKDYYGWETTTTPPHASEWTPWWKPLMTPDEAIQSDVKYTMNKFGIGEKQPLYMLDVRPDARFQSNIYQPFPTDLLQSMGITPTLHQGQSYAALTDILAWLVRKTL